MTKSSLNADEIQILRLIQALDFGVIHGIAVSGGSVHLQVGASVVQTVKLDGPLLTTGGVSDALTRTDFELKREFKRLFEQRGRFDDCVLDIEVRHGLRFRLNIALSVEGFASSRSIGRSPAKG